MIQVKRSGDPTVIELRPNRSASWQQTKYLILIVAFTSLTIATGWALMGAWIILPFAGLEIALLSMLAYRTCRLTYGQQRLVIEGSTLTITKRLGQTQQSCTLPRESTRILVFKPRHSLGRDRLVVFQDGYSLPIGEWLNAEDTVRLRRLLEQLQLPCIPQGQVQRFALEPFPPEP